MTNIQSILSLGAMLFVSVTALRFNSTVLQNSTLEIENKVYLTAFSLADDLIEEIKNKSFDKATTTFPTIAAANLTSPALLGPEAGETSATFNDIDDYNNFTKSVNAPHAENYTVTCKVFYVDPNNPDVKINTQSFYKKAQITVASPYMRTQVSLSFIFTLK